MTTTEIFEERESAVRSYCRSWPVVFDRAEGSWLHDEDGRAYLDFFAGAGALNYGHNNPLLKQTLLDYLASDRVIHSLDMYTVAKREFLTAFDEIILRPRRLDYRVQFAGPGGANAVEAALKLVRKVTGRVGIVTFTNAFHGATLGALSVTGNAYHRGASGVPFVGTAVLPYDGYLSGYCPDFEWFEHLLADRGSGLDKPAAAIVETVQGEGGIHVARPQWLRDLASLCESNQILLIVDDVQMGCGRTGGFFSFEEAGITPDIVCLSKSIGGYGLPLALTLIRPELDIWCPGEHNGTFRGVDPALVAGTAAIRAYWRDDALERQTVARDARISTELFTLTESVPGGDMIEVRGRGMAHCLDFRDDEIAGKVAAAAFGLGLLVETAGAGGEVVKLMPPLTITDEELDLGLALLADAVHSIC